MNTQSIVKYPSTTSDSPQMKALDDALKLFLEILSEVATAQGLSNEQVSTLEAMIRDIYLEKKMEYYLQPRLGQMNGRINKLLSSSHSGITQVFHHLETFSATW